MNKHGHFPPLEPSCLLYKGNPTTLQRKLILSACMFFFFCHVTIGEGWNNDRPINGAFHISTQSLIHHDRLDQHTHYCSRSSSCSIPWLLKKTLTYRNLSTWSKDFPPTQRDHLNNTVLLIENHGLRLKGAGSDPRVDLLKWMVLVIDWWHWQKYIICKVQNQVSEVPRSALHLFSLEDQGWSRWSSSALH